MTIVSFLEFRSRIDRWMVWLLLGSCGVLLVSSVLTLIDKTTGSFTMSLILLSTLICVPFLLWILMGTSYRLTDSQLLIRSGPIKTTVQLNDITSIEPIRSFQSSPALSRDRFLIRHGQFTTVMVSPRDRGEFLQEIANRATHLIWEEEKLVTIS